VAHSPRRSECSPLTHRKGPATGTRQRTPQRPTSGPPRSGEAGHSNENTGCEGRASEVGTPRPREPHIGRTGTECPACRCAARTNSSQCCRRYARAPSMSLSQAASARWHHLRRHRVPLPDASYSSDSCSADMGHTGASTCESAHKSVEPKRQRSSACCYTGPDTRAAGTGTGGKGGWRRTTTRKPKRVLSWRAACDENLSTNRSEDTVRAGRPWAPYLQQQRHRCITTCSEQK
jgi:hypothetical protein